MGSRNKICAFVRIFMLDSNTFTNTANLNEPRADSSAATAGDKVYVFGGKNEDNEYYDTIEMLEVSSQDDGRWIYHSPLSKWEVIRTPLFTARAHPTVCTLNPERILICGGSYNGEKLNDVIILETKELTSSKVTEAPFAFDTYYHNN